jgi:hypothetical protein
MPSRPAPNRTISLSEALRHARSREEQETLLQDCDDHADQYGLFYDTPGRFLNLNPHADLPVYTSIHRYVLIASLVALPGTARDTTLLWRKSEACHFNKSLLQRPCLSIRNTLFH